MSPLRPQAAAGSALPRGFYPLIAAQFASALADNALLIVTMAVLHRRGFPSWWAPLLKFGFTLSYVVLAPWVGPLADAVPKARLMAWMNGVKVLGVLGLLVGLHPVLAFTVVGFGAAAYAPAKYGLITEMVPGHALVRANGWIEVTVVGAALLGTVLGGLLVSPWLLQQAWFPDLGHQFGGLLSLADDRLGGSEQFLGALSASLGLLLVVYAIAAAFNLRVPDSGARYAPLHSLHPIALTRDFWRTHLRLWRDPLGGLSLAVTTLFWGVGATLQFIVLRWAGERLALPLSQAAYLQGAVAVGVVAGAWAAGRLIRLAQAPRLIWLGVALGLAMPVVAQTRQWWLAAAMLAGVGAIGGLMVVPLNALLQTRGHALLSAGRSIAIQGFNENASILIMLAAYSGLIALDLPILELMTGFGLFIAAFNLWLLWRHRHTWLRPLPIEHPDSSS
jgi:MFS family permease